jgi:uncharacterized protein YbaP (TraB family)
MNLRPIIAAALLLLPLSPASAQSVPHYSLEQDYEPAPAIWKLSDEDTTIYLFGTIHLLPAGFEWRNAQFNRIVDEVDTLVLESSEEDAMASLAALAPKMQSVNASRPATSQRLSPMLRTNWRQMVESSGRVFDEVDNMPLPLAMLGFDSGGEDSGLSRHELGVESVLQAEFMASGRPVTSIENHGAVMLSLMRIDDAPILAELSAELARWPGAVQPGQRAAPMRQDWSMEHAWAQGQIDPDFDLGLGSGKVGAAFQRVLLARRNERWSYWLKSRLDQPGTILVAVGAGHFEGRRSVHYFLQQRGLAAERIN